MRTAGLIYDKHPHYLDHLAPLCAQLQIPLILTEDTLHSQARAFYPKLSTILWPPLETPEKLIRSFERVIVSTPRILFDEVFFFAQSFHKKTIETIWCPHGNSDKGRGQPFMEALREEKHLLTYGPRMEAFLREKGITGEMTCIGNYRYHYYKEHQLFYDRLVSKKKTPTLLYAPTWQDREKNSSFPNFWPHILDVPSSYTLLVKLHPNLLLQFPNEIEKLKNSLPSHVILLENTPWIYPILAQTDLLIGDMSSIGYDFLVFNRPMITLHPSGLGQFVAADKYPDLYDYCTTLLTLPFDHSSLYGETFAQMSV